MDRLLEAVSPPVLYPKLSCGSDRSLPAARKRNQPVNLLLNNFSSQTGVLTTPVVSVWLKTATDEEQPGELFGHEVAILS